MSGAYFIQWGNTLMDWLTFIVEMTKALGSFAWPVAIVVIIILLRLAIIQRIGDIIKLRVGNLFEIELREAIKQAEATLPEPSEVTKIVTGHIEAVGRAEGKAEVIGEAEIISPELAIIDAWVEVESALRKAASANGIAVTNRSNSSQLMKALMKLEKVDRQTYEIFKRLGNLRNMAAHERPTDINADQAIEYRELTRRLAAKLMLLHS